MFKLTPKGDWSKTERYLRKLDDEEYFKSIEALAELGVKALADSTPVRTGLTASSWTYEIEKNGRAVTVSWKNTNVTSQGDPVAILLQYGHGTGTGGYVHGYDYINPAMRPVFDIISDRVWEAIASS